MKKIFILVFFSIGLLMHNDCATAQTTDFTNIGISSGITSLNINPAYQPGGKKGFVTILDAGVTMLLPEKYNSLVQKNSSGQEVIIMEDLIHALGMRPLSGVAHMGIGAGIHTKVGYFTLQLSVREDLYAKVDKGLARLLSEGNEHLVGASESLGGVNLKSMLYSEFNIGYSRKFLSDKLTVGGRIKLLGGQLGLATLKSDVHYHSSPQAELIEIESLHQIGMSNLFEYQKDEGGNIMLSDLELKTNRNVSDFMPKNIGLGFDIGATYTVSDRLTVSGALNDIGFIKWSKDVDLLESNLMDKNKLVYKGVKINNSPTPVGPDTEAHEINNLQEQLMDSFRESEEMTSFTTSLNTRMHLATTYDAYKWLTVTGVIGGNIYGGVFTPWTSIIGTVTKGKNLACSMSLNAMRFAPVSLGLGFRLGPVTIATDNILSVAYKHTRHTNVHLGVSFDLK